MVKFSILSFELLKFVIRYCLEFRYSHFEFGYFSSEAKSSASTIGPTCAFDAKIYKNVDAVLTVSTCVVWNKKIFNFFYFYFQLQAVLVENFLKNIGDPTFPRLIVDPAFLGRSQ